jgi:hypothetical protein
VVTRRVVENSHEYELGASVTRPKPFSENGGSLDYTVSLAS